MQDRPLVGVVHGAGDLGHQLGDGARVILEPRDVPGQVSPLDELHAEVRLIVLLADLVDRDDMGVIELGDRLGLVPKAAEIVRAGQGTSPDQFDGHQAIELVLTRPIDNSHATPCDLLEELVLTQESGESTRGTGRRRVGLPQ
jgi:hypothetical protein